MTKRRPEGYPRITLRNVSRIELASFGWRVNIKRSRKSYWKDFPDGPDGPFQSLRQAVVWRNSMWARLGPPSHVKRADKRNATGILGVSREAQRIASGTVFETWVGKWPDADGRSCKESFSIDKYGEADARRRASAARDAGIAATNKERLRRWRELLFMQNRMLRAGSAQ